MQKLQLSIGLDNPILSNRLRSFDGMLELPAKKPEKVLRITAPVYAQKLKPAPQTNMMEKASAETAEELLPVEFYFDDIESDSTARVRSPFRPKLINQRTSSALIITTLLLLSLSMYIAIFGLRINQYLFAG